MYRGWTQIKYQNKHYNINQNDEGTLDDRGRDGGTDFIVSINPLSAELNHICHLLALLRIHHILHVSRIRVKEQKTLLTFLEHEHDDDDDDDDDVSPLPITFSLLIFTLYIDTASNVSSKHGRTCIKPSKILEEPCSGFRLKAL